MKQTFISTMAVRFYELAGILACLSLAGCEYFHDGETCISKWEEQVYWTAASGITDFSSARYKDLSTWYANLTPADRVVHYPNVCPNSPFYLRVRVLEMSDLSGYPKLRYRAVLSYNYGERFEGFNIYDLVRKGPTLVEADIVTIPDMLSLLDEATVVNVAVWVQVPYVGNETESKALDWAEANIDEIYLDANYTRYK